VEVAPGKKTITGTSNNTNTNTILIHLLDEHTPHDPPGCIKVRVRVRFGSGIEFNEAPHSLIHSPVAHGSAFVGLYWERDELVTWHGMAWR
jgi:hypothetical protein